MGGCPPSMLLATGGAPSPWTVPVAFPVEVPANFRGDALQLCFQCNSSQKFPVDRSSGPFQWRFQWTVPVAFPVDLSSGPFQWTVPVAFPVDRSSGPFQWRFQWTFQWRFQWT